MAYSDGVLTESERKYYKEFFTNNAQEFTASSCTVEEFQKYLGSPIKTPLGNVRMGANQYNKFISKNRGNLFIAAYETLKNPLIIFTADNGSKVFVKSFVSDSGKRKIILSATIVKEDSMIAITTHEERLNQVLNKMKKTGILYEKAPGL